MRKDIEAKTGITDVYADIISLYQTRYIQVEGDILLVCQDCCRLAYLQ
jgi:hypothetical protein